MAGRRLTFKTIHIGHNGDPGQKEGEWNLTYRVEGFNQFSWKNKHVLDNHDYPLGNSVDSTTGSFHVLAEGFEDDDGILNGGDETLPRIDAMITESLGNGDHELKCDHSGTGRATYSILISLASI